MAVISRTGGIIPQPGESLHDISIQFWGTPEVAAHILAVNGMHPEVVAAGVHGQIRGPINDLAGIGMNVPPAFVQHFETRAIQIHGNNAVTSINRPTTAPAPPVTPRPRTPPPAPPPPPSRTPASTGGGGGGSTQTLAPEINPFADDIARIILRDLGLPASLSRQVNEWIKAGLSSDEIEILLRDTPQFQARFPGIAEALENGFAISPAQYIEYENRLREILNAGGVNDFFSRPRLFNDLVTSLISTGTSIVEVADRVDLGVRRGLLAPPEIRQFFAENIGPGGDRALIAWALDANNALPEIERAFETAAIGGRAVQQGFDLSLGRAQQLANQGIVEQQAWEGFVQLRDLTNAGLFDETFGETRDLTPLGEGVGSIFEIDPEARQAVEQRLERRRAFGRGLLGGAVVTREGAVGLGEAR